MRATNEKCEYSEEKEKRREEEIEEETLSPGAPPAPVRLPGQKFFEEKFSPFQCVLPFFFLFLVSSHEKFSSFVFSSHCKMSSSGKDVEEDGNGVGNDDDTITIITDDDDDDDDVRRRFSKKKATTTTTTTTTKDALERAFSRHEKYVSSASKGRFAEALGIPSEL